EKELNCNLEDEKLTDRGLLTCQLSVKTHKLDLQSRGACQCFVSSTSFETEYLEELRDNGKFFKIFERAQDVAEQKEQFIGLLDISLDKEKTKKIGIVTDLSSDWFDQKKIRVGVNVGGTVAVKVANRLDLRFVAGSRVGTEDEEDPIGSILRGKIGQTGVLAVEIGLKF
ncbi:MAG: hypothetical protein HOM21_15155, partial [Halobacteriovoraceae bacterium]|nr:hypothetical protein [Halobacteriovoraceae bacterium]